MDLENDGDLDIFICNNHELVINGEDRLRQPAEPVLLRNDTPRVNHWLKVNLAGAPPWHRDGIGSRVYVRTGTTRRGWDTSKWLALSPAARAVEGDRGRVQMRELNASTGYLAHGPERIAHFGLGSAAIANEVFV